MVTRSNSIGSIGSRNREPEVTKIELNLDRFSSPLDHFVERKKETTDYLHVGLEANSLQILCGPQGIGKTALMRKYVELYREKYCHLILINGRDREALEADFKFAGKKILNLTLNREHAQQKQNYDDQQLRNLVLDVYDGVRSTGSTREVPSLIIIENLDTTAMDKILPPQQQEPRENEGAKRLRFLVTTRDAVEVVDGRIVESAIFPAPGPASASLLTIELCPFGKGEAKKLFFEMLKFGLDDTPKNKIVAMRLFQQTAGNPKLLKQELSFRVTMLRYRSKFLKQLKNPRTIADALLNASLLEKDQVDELKMLPVREHKKFALWDSLFFSITSNTLHQVYTVLKNAPSGEKPAAVFDTIQKIANTGLEGPPSWTIHNAASVRNMTDLETLLKRDCEDICTENFWINSEKKWTPLHVAVWGEDTKGTLTFIKALYEEVSGIIIEQRGTQEQKNWLSSIWRTPQSFLDHGDAEGKTALHLAIQNQSVEVAKWLYDQRANILVPAKDQVTPLEMMYEKAPQVVTHILDKALPPCEDHATKGDLTIELDLTAILGFIEQSIEVKGDSSSSSQSPRTSSNGHTSVAIAMDTGAGGGNRNSFQMKPIGANAGENDGSGQTQDAAQPLINLVTKTTTVIEDPVVLTTATVFKNSGKFNKKQVPLETYQLARMVFNNFEDSSKLILSHPVTKAFLELKWKKLARFIQAVTCFYVILHLWFTYFIISVFIISNPHHHHHEQQEQNDETVVSGDEIDSIKNNNSFELGGNMIGSRNGWTMTEYLIGNLTISDNVVQLSDGKWSGWHFYQGLVGFIPFGIFCLIIEIYEWFLRKQITRANTWSSIWSYLLNFENFLQLLFILLMISVSTVVVQDSISDWYYILAALSVVVAWTLILLQFGNFHDMGKFVEILKTGLRSFFTVMGIYLALIVAFCISFSILFHQENLFLTLPTSLFRALNMMSGEIGYDEVFKLENVLDPLLPFPLVKHVAIAGFTIILTIVLMNLLVGLTVSDIQKIRGKSDNIHRSIQIEKLFLMENFVVHVVSWIISDIDFMYVVPGSEKEMIISKSITEFPSKLQKDLRQLLAKNEVRDSENSEAAASGKSSMGSSCVNIDNGQHCSTSECHTHTHTVTGQDGRSWVTVRNCNVKGNLYVAI